MKKAVILDGGTITCSDLTWDELEKLCDLTVYEDSSYEEAEERIRDAEIIFTSKVSITAELMDMDPCLKYIGVLATGFDNVDTDAARKRNIAVSNIPAYSTEAVAQHAIALMLEITNSVGFHNDLVHKGEWNEARGFCFFERPLMLLAGKTLGIVGYGNIGKRTAEIAKALGMEILIYSRDGEKALAADFVSLHIPLNDDTAGFINKETIVKMKDGAYLINTARGGLINEKDLLAALDRGKIAGFAADVLAEEPPAPGDPLASHPKAVITPHNCWCSPEIRSRITKVTAENLKSWLNGEKKNRVD